MDQTVMKENEAILNMLHTELHAEHKHLTTKGVAIEHSIPRSVAASLLEILPYFNRSGACTYKVTRCILEKMNGSYSKYFYHCRNYQIEYCGNICTFLTPKLEVAKLNTETETISDDDMQSDHKNAIHSIALETSTGASSTLAAHMQTLSLLHDHQESMLDPTMACDVIAPALEVEVVDKDALRSERMETIGSGSGSGSGSKIGNVPKANSTKSNTKNNEVKKAPTVIAKKKSTSAASFFGKNESALPKSKSSKSSTISSIPKKKKTMTATTTTVTTSPSTKKKPIRKSKTSESPKKQIPIEKKGNADDFVGDEDEDDDFLKEDEERKKRNAIAEKEDSLKRKMKEEKSKHQVTRKTRKIIPRDEGDENQVDMAIDKDMDVDEHDDHEKEEVHGAIDAFATKKKVKKDPEPEQLGRKRRMKVLEEKTFIDNNGFFRTETVSVWKDVDEEDDGDEEDKEKGNGGVIKQSATKVKPKSKAKAKSTKNMKQQGLMGFFAKKK